MRRVICVLLLGAFAGAILFTSWATRSRWARAYGLPSMKETVEAVVTNPVEFAKNRLTGGVGVQLTADPASGLPSIRATSAGSPADRSGLRAGDIITKVDGLGTKGRPIFQVAESIRGFSAGEVALTVQRGSTNIEFVIRRSSLNVLRSQSFNPYE